MECPHCKANNPDGIDFCISCGQYLDKATTSASSLRPGSRLQSDRYIVERILSQGGMGAAVLAIDTRLGSKYVVIKELISDSTDPTKLQEAAQNFRREVQMLAHIEHPLVPGVTDYFQEGLHYFMAQDYVKGESLEERMNRLNQPMDERDVLVCASQVLDVLDYLSQQNPPIVHRDIKPANIIIGANDKRAHLVDFGIARTEVYGNAGQKQTAPLGTQGYAPPEQYQRKADARSDLYALAATLHYLLTNRDPRYSAPFAFPPVRSLNTQLSAEIEQVLLRALQQNVNQRYQSAIMMKHEIDDILLKRFGLSGGLHTATIADRSTIILQPLPPAPPPANPVPPVRQRVSHQPQPPLQPQNRPVRSHARRNVMLIVLVMLLLGAAAFYYVYRQSSTTPSMSLLLSSGIGVFETADGERIGVSDGSYAFDTDRLDGVLKSEAADKLKQHDSVGAESLWEQAIAKDTNDAETLIYLEDQRVLDSQRPYITIVVGTILSGDFIDTGRDSLQGAYVAQKEQNDRCIGLPDCVQIRLLIANSGSGLVGNPGANESSTNGVAYASFVMEQIIKESKIDKTIVGVMGWPVSLSSLYVTTLLGAAHLPVVSPTASIDAITTTGTASNMPTYFFHVAPSNQLQGIAGAQYAEHTLHARRVAVFVDPVDAYSESLANEFAQRFTADGNTIVVTENYTTGKPDTIAGRVADALNHHPDLIYFSGHANDVGGLLTSLPACGASACLQVLGGDGLYELGGYPASVRGKQDRLHFTAFAYPDEWGILAPSAQERPFFSEYPQAFDPNGKHAGGEYGYRRADSHVILSYDAMLALLNASNLAFGGGKQSFTPEELEQALTEIAGPQAIQGVSGRISFGPDGNPTDKAVLVLHVDALGQNHFDQVFGCFLKPLLSAPAGCS